MLCNFQHLRANQTNGRQSLSSVTTDGEHVASLEKFGQFENTLDMAAKMFRRVTQVNIMGANNRHRPGIIKRINNVLGRLRLLVVQSHMMLHISLELGLLAVNLGVFVVQLVG